MPLGDTSCPGRGNKDSDNVLPFRRAIDGLLRTGVTDSRGHYSTMMRRCAPTRTRSGASGVELF